MDRGVGDVSGYLRAVAMMVALASLLAPDCVAQDMRRTAHDLRGRLPYEMRDDSAICVFCHAPQGARTASAKAPQWQSNLNGSGSFETYVMPNNGSRPALDTQGTSTVCLSCHDAAQAPLISGVSGDHPIGVPYAGFGGTDVGGVWQPATIEEQRRAHQARATGRSGAARGMATGRNGFRAPMQSLVDGRVVWWVATSLNAGRRTRSDLPLYGSLDSTADLQAAEMVVPTVECATCHDPHIATASFLRIDNGGSRVCLSCHDE